MERNRHAALVVLDDQGEPLGVTDRRTVRPPWWQDADGLAATFPDLLGPIHRNPDSDRSAAFEPAEVPAVLRLLSAEPDETGHMGGSATYLIQLGRRSGRPADLRRSELGRWVELMADDALRLPWARPGGPATDLTWVASHVRVTGPPTQHRTWNLSAIWSFPTPHGTVWLKCLPPFFAHEPSVLRVLADQPVPSVIAAEGHRLLMADLPGEDGYDADLDEQVAMVETLVGIQQVARERRTDLLDAGVPDGRTEALIADLTDLVGRVAPGSAPLQRLVDELPDRLSEVGSCGLPDTLVHGDPHGGNARRGVTPPVWFDWGDSFIGNPLLDLGAVHRMDPVAIERWLDLWSEEAARDLRPAWRVLQPIALLRTASVHQGFLDRIEPTERVYHQDDVPATLTQVEATLNGADEP